MTKKYILTFFTLLIFISTLLINCGDDLSFKKEISNRSNSKIIKEKTKKENLEETKYYINKNYDSLLNICKEWQSLKELIKEEDEEDNEAIKNKVFYIFKNIKHIWLKIEKRAIPNSYDGENFFNELKFIKEKQLKAIEYFTEGIHNKKPEAINEGIKYLKESNNYINSDIIPYIEQVNTSNIN